MNWRKRIRWIVLYPALILAGFHTLGTGSPIPLWHIEHLNAPVLVRSITKTHLHLEDGRKITLPLIKELPHDNSLFRAAISNGIEVGTSGQVHGLMWTDRSCGNDPVVWRRLRVDLSVLAAALNPVGIDDTHVHPDVIAFIQEHHRIDMSAPSRSHRNQHLSGWDWTRMRSVQREMDRAQAN